MEWIRESNLIEDVDDHEEDARSQRAWRWLINEDLTLPNILKLHKRIMLKKLGSQAGKWRTCRVWVGGREGIPHQEIEQAMELWLSDYFSAATAPIPRPDIIQQFHVKFEHIHPFIDGNGRTGRMIMNLQRVRAGLEPLNIRAVSRFVYYKWFRSPGADT